MVFKTSYNLARNAKKNDFKMPSRTPRLRLVNIVTKVFKRPNLPLESAGGVLIKRCQTTSNEALFGRSLTELCRDRQDLPRPILDLLTILFLEGPSTSGIFRISVSEKKVQGLQAKLDKCSNFNYLKGLDPILAAVLLKRFLRSLPDCLLSSDLYDDWVSVSSISKNKCKIAKIKKLIDKLPVPNQLLLKRLLVILYFVSKMSCQNKMSSSNLSICIGHSIMWPSFNSTMSSTIESSMEAPTVVQFMIENYKELFETNIYDLFPDFEKMKSLTPGLKRWGNLENLDFTNVLTNVEVEMKEIEQHHNKRTFSLCSVRPLKLKAEVKPSRTFRHHKLGSKSKFKIVKVYEPKQFYKLEKPSFQKIETICDSMDGSYNLWDGYDFNVVPSTRF